MFVLETVGMVVLNYLNYQYDYENGLLIEVLQVLMLTDDIHVMMRVL
jgi:hypothetical protein